MSDTSPDGPHGVKRQGDQFPEWQRDDASASTDNVLLQPTIGEWHTGTHIGTEYVTNVSCGSQTSTTYAGGVVAGSGVNVREIRTAPTIINQSTTVIMSPRQPHPAPGQDSRGHFGYIPQHGIPIPPQQYQDPQAYWDQRQETMVPVSYPAQPPHQPASLQETAYQYGHPQTQTSHATHQPYQHGHPQTQASHGTHQPYQQMQLVQQPPQRQPQYQSASTSMSSQYSGECPPYQSPIESHRSIRQFPPGQPLPKYVRKLTDTITAFTDKPLSEKAHVYPGEQRMGGMLEIRLVAVKVVRHTDKKMREARNLVKLTPHVNVVSIYHADMLARSFEARIYIVMEKCNPETLECHIKKRKSYRIPFNPSQALDIAKQIIEGINHIHKNNIIHRDLKPGSVLFSLCGRFVKIIDFGMSKELKYGLSVMSLSTLPLGTDGYRAPETYNEDKIKKQADIFSLGILLYHIWSNGCHPFGPGPDIWSYNIKNHIPPNFSNLLIPDAKSASDLLTGMLKIDPEQRSTIDDVKAHPFIKQTVEEAFKKAVTLIWSGSIQQVSGESNETLENCTLYRNENGPTVEFDSFSWRLDMQHLPIFDRKKISMPICKIPDGYLAMKKSCVKKLSEKLAEEKKMAWIDIYNDDDERIRSLMIIRPKGYDDVYGVMATNPDEFMENILGVKPQEKETTPKQTVEGMDESQTEGPHSEDSVPIASAPGGDASSQTGNSNEGAQAAGVVPQDTKDDESGEVEQMTPVGATPSQRPLGQLEFIAWWHPEEEQEEAAAGAASSSRN